MATVHATIKKVTNLGNYESLAIEVGFQDEVRAGESPQEAFERVYHMSEKNLVLKVQEAVKGRR